MRKDVNLQGLQSNNEINIKRTYEYILYLNMSVAFHKFIAKSVKHRELYMKIAPILTDVSLRDGIQNANPEIYSTIHKKDIFQTILFQENPNHMEVGSLASSKILPIMSDSLAIHKYASNKEWLVDRELMIDLFDIGNRTVLPLDSQNKEKRYFLLIPSISKLPKALDAGIKHFSFTTSTSEKFQIKNTQMNLNETKMAFSDMFIQYPIMKDLYTKLYISCIRECPIIGPVDLDWIVKEILYYHGNYPFQEICLSDTCGSLKYNDFEYIVETVKIFGLPYSKLSLHLHVPTVDENREIEQILRYCFKNGIRKFDVSILQTGGCSVTMNQEQIYANLSYQQFYKALQKYIEVIE